MFSIFKFVYRCKPRARANHPRPLTSLQSSALSSWYKYIVFLHFPLVSARRKTIAQKNLFFISIMFQQPKNVLIESYSNCILLQSGIIETTNRNDRKRLRLNAFAWLDRVTLFFEHNSWINTKYLIPFPCSFVRPYRHESFI